MLNGISKAQTRLVSLPHLAQVGLLAAQLSIQRKRWGTTDGTTSGQKTEISYTLSDDDQGDQFQVDAYRDRQYGTPFFKLGNGSKTSCPYEGGYQLDQPSLKTVIGTDDTHITVNSTSTSSTAFQLNLCNNSNVERDYFFSLKSTSNSGGAQVACF